MPGDNVILVLSAQDADVRRILDRTGKGVTKLGDTAERQGKRQQGAFDRVGGSISKASNKVPQFGGQLNRVFSSAAKGPVGLLAGAIAAVGGSIALSINHVANLEKELRPMQERSGLSAEALQRLTKVAERLGSQDGLEGVTDASQELRLRLGELVLDGTGPAGPALEKLGLSAEELSSKLPEEALQDTITALQGVENETQRAFLADELYGGASEKLAGIINATTEEYKAHTAAVDASGTVVSEKGISNAREFNLAMGRLGASFTSIAQNIGTVFIPIVTKLVDGFNNAYQFLRNSLAPVFTNQVGPALATTGEVLRSVWRTIQTELLPALQSLWSRLQEAVLPIVQRLWTVFKEDVVPILQDVWGRIQRDLVPALQELFAALEVSVIPALEKLWNFAENFLIPALRIFINIVGTQVKNALAIATGAVQVLSRVLTGDFQGAWLAIQETALKVVTNIVDLINKIPGIDIDTAPLEAALDRIQAESAATASGFSKLTDSQQFLYHELEITSEGFAGLTDAQKVALVQTASTTEGFDKLTSAEKANFLQSGLTIEAFNNLTDAERLTFDETRELIEGQDTLSGSLGTAGAAADTTSGQFGGLTGTIGATQESIDEAKASLDAGTAAQAEAAAQSADLGVEVNALEAAIIDQKVAADELALAEADLQEKEAELKRVIDDATVSVETREDAVKAYDASLGDWQKASDNALEADRELAEQQAARAKILADLEESTRKQEQSDRVAAERAALYAEATTEVEEAAVERRLAMEDSLIANGELRTAEAALQELERSGTASADELQEAVDRVVEARGRAVEAADALAVAEGDLALIQQKQSQAIAELLIDNEQQWEQHGDEVRTRLQEITTAIDDGTGEQVAASLDGLREMRENLLRENDGAESDITRHIGNVIDAYENGMGPGLQGAIDNFVGYLGEMTTLQDGFATDTEISATDVAEHLVNAAAEGYSNLLTEAEVYYDALNDTYDTGNDELNDLLTRARAAQLLGQTELHSQLISDIVAFNGRVLALQGEQTRIVGEAAAERERILAEEQGRDPRSFASYSSGFQQLQESDADRQGRVDEINRQVAALQDQVEAGALSLSEFLLKLALIERSDVAAGRETGIRGVEARDDLSHLADSFQGLVGLAKEVGVDVSGAARPTAGAFGGPVSLSAAQRQFYTAVDQGEGEDDKIVLRSDAADVLRRLIEEAMGTASPTPGSPVVLRGEDGKPLDEKEIAKRNKVIEDARAARAERQSAQELAETRATKREGLIAEYGDTAIGNAQADVDLAQDEQDRIAGLQSSAASALDTALAEGSTASVDEIKAAQREFEQQSRALVSATRALERAQENLNKQTVKDEKATTDATDARNEATEAIRKQNAAIKEAQDAAAALADATDDLAKAQARLDLAVEAASDTGAVATALGEAKAEYDKVLAEGSEATASEINAAQRAYANALKAQAAVDKAVVDATAARDAAQKKIDDAKQDAIDKRAEAQDQIDADTRADTDLASEQGFWEGRRREIELQVGAETDLQKAVVERMLAQEKASAANRRITSARTGRDTLGDDATAEDLLEKHKIYQDAVKDYERLHSDYLRALQAERDEEDKVADAQNEAIAERNDAIAELRRIRQAETDATAEATRAQNAYRDAVTDLEKAKARKNLADEIAIETAGELQQANRELTRLQDDQSSTAEQLVAATDKYVAALEADQAAQDELADANTELLEVQGEIRDAIDDVTAAKEREREVTDKAAADTAKYIGKVTDLEKAEVALAIAEADRESAVSALNTATAERDAILTKEGVTVEEVLAKQKAYTDAVKELADARKVEAKAGELVADINKEIADASDERAKAIKDFQRADEDKDNADDIAASNAKRIADATGELAKAQERQKIAEEELAAAELERDKQLGERDALLEDETATGKEIVDAHKEYEKSLKDVLDAEKALQDAQQAVTDIGDARADAVADKTAADEARAEVDRKAADAAARYAVALTDLAKATVAQKIASEDSEAANTAVTEALESRNRVLADAQATGADIIAAEKEYTDALKLAESATKALEKADKDLADEQKAVTEANDANTEARNDARRAVELQEDADFRARVEAERLAAAVGEVAKATVARDIASEKSSQASETLADKLAYLNDLRQDESASTEAIAEAQKEYQTAVKESAQALGVLEKAESALEKAEEKAQKESDDAAEKDRKAQQERTDAINEANDARDRQKELDDQASYEARKYADALTDVDKAQVGVDLATERSTIAARELADTERGLRLIVRDKLATTEDIEKAQADYESAVKESAAAANELEKAERSLENAERKATEASNKRTDAINEAKRVREDQQNADDKAAYERKQYEKATNDIAKAEVSVRLARERSSKASRELSKAEFDLRNIVESETATIDDIQKAQTEYESAVRESAAATDELAKATKSLQDLESAARKESDALAEERRLAVEDAKQTQREQRTESERSATVRERLTDATTDLAKAEVIYDLAMQDARLAARDLERAQVSLNKVISDETADVETINNAHKEYQTALRESAAADRELESAKKAVDDVNKRINDENDRATDESRKAAEQRAKAVKDALDDHREYTDEQDRAATVRERLIGKTTELAKAEVLHSLAARDAMLANRDLARAEVHLQRVTDDGTASIDDIQAAHQRFQLALRDSTAAERALESAGSALQRERDKESDLDVVGGRTAVDVVPAVSPQDMAKTAIPDADLSKLTNFGFSGITASNPMPVRIVSAGGDKGYIENHLNVQLQLGRQQFEDLLLKTRGDLEVAGRWT